jgi:putative GTP pyrophosphokinase
MQTKTKNKILREYDTRADLYESYGRKLSALLDAFLDDAGVSVHSVSFRRKEKESLNKKLGKQGANYEELADITDICGLRIITYFDDDVKEVCAILEREFQIDDANSSDKAESLDPDRFGYLSVHYVVSNGAGRSNLTEYKKFEGIKAEIQVRSILQHAWAEIEHDLGYKSKNGVPRAVRRRFSRLAGLLELADQEFRTIRDELDSYSNQVLESIESDSSEVDLNAVSLKALITNNEDLKRIDSAIAKAGKCDIDESDDDYGIEAARLAFFGIATIDELMNALAVNENSIVEFCGQFLASDIDRGGSFSPGISIFYLAYVLALSSESEKTLKDYVKAFIRLGDQESENKLIETLRGVYERMAPHQ